MASESLERSRRESRAAVARLRRAGIGLRFALAESRTAERIADALMAASEERARALALSLRGQGLSARPSDLWAVGLVGESGSGKTTTASVVAKRCLDAGWSVLMTRSLDIIEGVKATFDGRASRSEALARLTGPDLLVIDDLGKEVPGDWSTTLLFEVVDARYRDAMATVWTSQYDSDGLERRLAGRGAEAGTAAAIMRRLLDGGRALTLPDRRGD